MNKPNILFVLTDDQGCGDLGCLGNPVVETPNIDAFHEDSIRLTNFHVGPTCAPTRSGLFTGHYANSTGVWHTIGGRSLLRGNEVSIADVFSENGYATGLFGKWHLGDNYPYRPQDRGFQETIVHGGGGISQMPDYWQNDYFDDTFSVNGEPHKFEGYCTDVWFREGLSFMERHRAEPFMCFITPNAPHSPYNVEPEYSDRYKGRAWNSDRERFYGMITNVDQNFGIMRERLDRLGLTDNTIVIFMTDNGTSCGGDFDENEFLVNGYNSGLRGKKGSAYDGGHRVPFFIHWPAGALRKPEGVDNLSSFVDFMPTLMDLAGIDLQHYSHLNFHGRSLKPLLTGESTDWPDRVITTDSQRLPNPVKWRQSAVMSRRWRLINGVELYDAENDREQRHDIGADYPDVVKKLRCEYEKWWDLVSVQFDDEIPISIGSLKEKETCLRSHDWRHPDNPKWDDPTIPEDNDYTAYEQGQVRQGEGRTGYFEINVEVLGIYRFELRRWPKEEDRAITEGIAESEEGWRSDIISEMRYLYSGGRALPISDAELKINNRRWSKKVSPGDKGVVFEIDLAKGPVHLSATFSNDDGYKLGAYYVYTTLLR